MKKYCPKCGSDDLTFHEKITNERTYFWSNRDETLRARVYDSSTEEIQDTHWECGYCGEIGEPKERPQ